jgi:hypothetical protein
MKEIRTTLEGIDMFDSELGPPVIEGSQLSIEVRNLILVSRTSEGFIANLQPVSEGTFRFRGVTKSERRIHEEVHGSEANGHRDRVEADGPFENQVSDNRRFFLEGVYRPARAFVSWEIRAKDFELLIEGDQGKQHSIGSGSAAEREQ